MRGLVNSHGLQKKKIKKKKIAAQKEKKNIQKRSEPSVSNFNIEG
jgi:hypothetical protein